MSRWFKFWTSSQPTIKQEAAESDASEHEVKGTKEGDMDVDMDVGLEEMIAIAQQEQEQREGKGEKEKRGGKKGRKGRKSRDLVKEPENEGQKLGEEGVNQNDDEEVPQLVEVIQEDIETSLGFRRKGRPNGSTTKRKRKSIEDDAPFRPGGVVPEEEEPPTLNEIKSANNKGRNTRSSKSRSELVEEDTDEDEPPQLKGMNDPPQEQATQDSVPEDGEESIPENLSDLSNKLRRAKKNAAVSPRRTVQVVIEPDVAHNDDPAAGLHKPLTPAHVERNRSHSTSHEEPPSNSTKDARLGASTEPEEEAEMTPKKPSKKALGKRKASDIDVSTSTSKKRKMQKDKAAGTPELASFGFIADPERRPTPMFTPINAPRASVLPPSGQRPNPPVKPLAYVDSDENIFVPEVPVLKSSERKKKRRLPVGDDAPNPQTPQNKGSRKSKTPKSPKSAAKTPQAKTPATSRTGKLTNEQFEAILAAVEGFREENDLTEFGINEIIQKDAKADTVGLWKRIHDAVPDAPRRSVQSMCRRKFHNFEARGQWTEEQDQELRDAYEKYPAKWKQIGETLNRFHEDCRDRWRNYGVCGDNMRKDAWDKEEEERLREVVQGCIESIREMKRVSTDANDKAKSDESLVDWNVVSQNMDRTRSRLQCLQKWKKMKEREEVIINDPVLAKPISETWRGAEAEDVARKMTPKEKLLLLYAVRESGAGREGKIPWRRVQEEVPGQPRKMTMKVAFREMRQHIEDNQEMALQDIVDLLVDAYEASVPSEPVGFDDNFELFRSSQKLLSNKKRKSRPKGAAEAEAQSSSDDNGEGPNTISKPKRRKTRLSEKFVVDNDEDADDIYAVPRDEPRTKSKRRRTASSLPAEETQFGSSATKNKRKLRDRMKSIGQSQSQSQERDDQRHSELSDVYTALESLKTGTSRARRAAAIEAAKSKGKQVLSEEQVVESDEEEQPPVEETPAERRAKAKRKRAFGKLSPSEERVVENGDEEAPSRNEGQSEHEDMEVDEEDPADAEEPSVHEDEPIANGASAEDDEEQSANETDPEVNEELSRNESEPSAYQEIEVDKDEIDLYKHDTLISPDPSEADEEEPSLAEETRSEKEEELPANQILEDDDDAMDMDNDDITYTAPGGPEAEDDDSLLEDEEDKHIETDQESVGLDEYEDEEETTHHDQESVDLDAARDASANEDMEVDEEEPSVAEGKPSTNGFHEEESSQNYGSDAETDFHGFQTEAGSVDLDTAVQTSHRHKSSSPAPSGEDTPKANGLLNGLAKGYNYHEEVSSDDDDMSDIPAKIIPKAKVVEAKREKKPKKDKKSKSKSKKRISGFR
ncbi:hypothetical protein L207DRAFT_457172 [Hyaloscypha variabilis F]|uniref:DNA-binding protein n=1 Tax=Hyaloscypha variabilis (strain UAMH 11265 / GT02V1 / F) TaxID=1149755 RepID=A0A2J6RW03_HYAVF|nr:hypothetical protein L207DRAFT_457172 [Hyaloscypha variabilis F]